jgi:hypothetical protein
MKMLNHESDTLASIAMLQLVKIYFHGNKYLYNSQKQHSLISLQANIKQQPKANKESIT